MNLSPIKNETYGGSIVLKKLLQIIGTLALKTLGWKVVGSYPKQQCVIVIAPHTSNWDFFFLLFLAFHWGVIGKCMWIGKHTIFRWPIDGILRSLGGRPVNRTQSNNLVHSIAGLMSEQPDLSLALAPEGTRSYKPHWKKGFYRIAQRAKVPISLAFVDFKSKRVNYVLSLLGLTIEVILHGMEDTR